MCALYNQRAIASASCSVDAIYGKTLSGSAQRLPIVPCCSHISHPQHSPCALPLINDVRPEIPLDRDYILTRAGKYSAWSVIICKSIRSTRFLNVAHVIYWAVSDADTGSHKNAPKMRKTKYPGTYGARKDKIKVEGYVTNTGLHSLSHAREVFAHRLSLPEQCNVHPMIGLYLPDSMLDA